MYAIKFVFLLIISLLLQGFLTKKLEGGGKYFPSLHSNWTSVMEEDLEVEDRKREGPHQSEEAAPCPFPLLTYLTHPFPSQVPLLSPLSPFNSFCFAPSAISVSFASPVLKLHPVLGFELSPLLSLPPSFWLASWPTAMWWQKGLQQPQLHTLFHLSAAGESVFPRAPQVLLLDPFIGLT